MYNFDKKIARMRSIHFPIKMGLGPDSAADYLEQTALALKEGNASKAIGIVHRYNEELLTGLSAAGTFTPGVS